MTRCILSLMDHESIIDPPLIYCWSHIGASLIQPVLTFLHETTVERSQSSIKIKILLPSVNIKFDMSVQFHPSSHIPSSGTSGIIIWYVTHSMFVNKSASGHFRYNKWHEEKRHWQFFQIWVWVGHIVYFKCCNLSDKHHRRNLSRFHIPSWLTLLSGWRNQVRLITITIRVFWSEPQILEYLIH